MSSHLSVARSERTTSNTQGRVTTCTISKKIVETLSSNRVTSEHKKLNTPLPSPPVGVFVLYYRQLEQQHNTVIEVGNRNGFTILDHFQVDKMSERPFSSTEPRKGPPINLVDSNL